MTKFHVLKYNNCTCPLFIVFFTLQNYNDTLKHGFSICKIGVDYLVWATNTNATASLLLNWHSETWIDLRYVMLYLRREVWVLYLRFEVWMLYRRSEVWMLYLRFEVWMLYLRSEVWMLYLRFDVWMLYLRFDVWMLYLRSEVWMLYYRSKVRMSYYRS